MVRASESGGIVPHLAREEAESRHQYYLGPEHLLLGLLVQDDTPATRVLRGHGLDLPTVRAGIDRLTTEGVLPGSQPRAPGAGTPLICWRVFSFAAREAAARGEEVTPGHWLLGLLRDAEDPIEVALDRYPVERRKRSMFGLPTRGPSPVRLLVESQGLALEQLRGAVLEELDRDR